jgi:hypothetical protein
VSWRDSSPFSSLFVANGPYRAQVTHDSMNLKKALRTEISQSVLVRASKEDRRSTAVPSDGNPRIDASSST